MKISEILQSVGLITNGTGSQPNSTMRGKVAQSYTGSNVERLHQGYQPYQTPHAYHQQMDPGLNPTVGNFYYPSAYNMFGQRGYGLKLSGGGHTHGIGPVGTGGYSSHAGGYGHTGYGGYIGGGTTTSNSDGGYEYGYSTGRQKSKGSSVMTALTLLSFFFFINLLQSCLKEHMDAMNPTVMVMTAGVARNRLNKFTEVNSREIPDSVNSEKVQLSHENDGRILYTNSTTMREYKIEPKLKNDYFRDGNTLYTRIN